MPTQGLKWNLCITTHEPDECSTLILLLTVTEKDQQWALGLPGMKPNKRRKTEQNGINAPIWM